MRATGRSALAFVRESRDRDREAKAKAEEEAKAKAEEEAKTKAKAEEEAKAQKEAEQKEAERLAAQDVQTEAPATVGSKKRPRQATSLVRDGSSCSCAVQPCSKHRRR